MEVVSPSHTLSHSLWQPSQPHNGPVRISHSVQPGKCPQGNAETHTLAFLYRLSWELPKYSSVRVNGVCIGEQLVRMS